MKSHSCAFFLFFYLVYIFLLVRRERTIFFSIQIIRYFHPITNKQKTKMNNKKKSWEGPWTAAPTRFSNLFFVELLKKRTVATEKLDRWFGF